MNAIWATLLRRNWRIAGALGAFLVFTVIHFSLFRPAAAHYRAVLASVGGIEAVFNPDGATPMLPPRLYALITENTLSGQDANERAGSGALGVLLLEDLGRAAGRAGLGIVTSEPGPVAQQALSVQIRAHLELRGRYSQIVSFFNELDNAHNLMLIDRFKIAPMPGGADQLEIWISRLYLKQNTEPKP